MGRRRFWMHRLKNGRHLPINDLSLPRFSADGPEVLFIQSTRNYQVLNLETGYPVTPPSVGGHLDRLPHAFHSVRDLLLSVENMSNFASWDLLRQQRALAC